MQYLCLAQAQWETYNTGNSPLQSNNIQSLAVDNNDLLWVATDVGLYLFDGSSWIIYDTTNSLIPSNNIRSVYVDDTNNVWIGTFNSGLAKLSSGGNWASWNTSNLSLIHI